jgi:multisubunit Na+/H+ antiporter MnhF subunit
MNYAAIELLAAFSVAVWALMSKTPIKLLIKKLAGRIFYRINYLQRTLNYDEWERYVILFFATLISLVLIGLAQTIDMAVLTGNLSPEWQWIADAEGVSAAAIIFLIPVKYSLLYYVDLALTVALVSIVGSAGIHRIEKWITGNGLLFDALRQWLVNSKQAHITGIDDNVPTA